jgi:hypothetical protein
VGADARVGAQCWCWCRMSQSSQPNGLRRPTANERLAGLTIVIIVAMIWIVSSFVVQELRLHPFLITYICNIMFVLYIPVIATRDISRCSITFFNFRTVCCSPSLGSFWNRQLLPMADHFILPNDPPAEGMIISLNAFSSIFTVLFCSLRL